VVVGMGYVGLPTALSLVNAGYQVLGVDLSGQRLAAIRSHSVDLSTQGQLEDLSWALDQGRLELSGDPAMVRTADLVLICVPTPIHQDHQPDPSFVRSACRSAVASARPDQLIVLTSTTYVGTTRELLIEPLRERGLQPGRDVFVAFSPERINPGGPLGQDQVARVVGGATAACAQRACEVLGRIAGSLHVVSSPEAAELTKLYENSFRAVNIAFVNEIADAARTLDLDVTEVIGAAATKPYGFMPFAPGPGVGGHCIPCDPHYLAWQLRLRSQPTPVLDQAMDAIHRRPARVAERAKEVLAGGGRRVDDADVLVVGVAYKPGVEDVRETPAREIIATLRADGARVDYHDPLVPFLELPDGEVLETNATHRVGSYDLVIAHTLHPGFDYGWIAQYPRVLDATYQLQDVPHRVLP
jgi:nucleotide sugar dehydrogenase